MAPSGRSDREERPRQDHRAEISGQASDVVQAGNISGGVHFHTAEPGTGTIPMQLPGDVGGFVNRSWELGFLNEVVADERPDSAAVGACIVTGTAGVGKTSLVLHWAHGVRHRFPDGQLYVNLCGYDPGPPVTPEQALDRFLRALHVPPGSIPAELDDKAALYRSLLANRRMLVVLDNAATVRQVRPLLPGNAECLALVTSRSRLSGLVARDGARRLAVDVLPEPEAIGLLRIVTAGYRAHDSAEELAELTRLCARLPLALRIAAERASSRPLMQLNELIADLRDESALWDALTAEDDEEADAVRTVFAWSYRALPESAARLFRLLGLHPGPEFGVGAAAAVAGIDIVEARHLLDVLVGAHVVEQHATRRWRFHDLLRAYAADQALQHESPESRRAALQRVVSWYLQSANNVAAAFAPPLRTVAIDPPEACSGVTPLEFDAPGEALQDYELEQANFVAAARAAAAADLHSFAWKIPAILTSLYSVQNVLDDWITTARIGLGSARELCDRRGEADLLVSLGMAYDQAERSAEAEERYRDALVVHRELGDRLGEAVVINCLGLLEVHRRRLTAAVSRFEESIAIAVDLGDRKWEAPALSNLGSCYYKMERLPEAAEVLRRAVDLAREVGDRGTEGNSLLYLAAAQREQGLHDDSLATIQTALSIAREDDHYGWEAFWLLEFAMVQRALGRPAEALTSYQRSAATQRRLGDRNREAMALDGTGETYQELGRPDEAAKFHRLAVAAFRELGNRWSLAVALDNLASALQEEYGGAEARPHRAEALGLFAEFEDARSNRMRARIGEILNDS